jgi:hypothetical protein
VFFLKDFKHHGSSPNGCTHKIWKESDIAEELHHDDYFAEKLQESTDSLSA